MISLDILITANQPIHIYIAWRWCGREGGSGTWAGEPMVATSGRAGVGREGGSGTLGWRTYGGYLGKGWELRICNEQVGRKHRGNSTLLLVLVCLTGLLGAFPHQGPDADYMRGHSMQTSPSLLTGTMEEVSPVILICD
jgi:hypothetical protein